MLSDKEISLLDFSKPKNILVREMTDEEKARISHVTRNSYFKKKYRMALEVTTKMMIREMYEQYPDRPLNDVLSAAMKEYNSDLPSVLLLEMAQLIVNEWERIQAKNKAMQLA